MLVLEVESQFVHFCLQGVCQFAERDVALSLLEVFEQYVGEEPVQLLVVW